MLAARSVGYIGAVVLAAGATAASFGLRGVMRSGSTAGSAVAPAVSMCRAGITPRRRPSRTIPAWRSRVERSSPAPQPLHRRDLRLRGRIVGCHGDQALGLQHRQQAAFVVEQRGRGRIERIVGDQDVLLIALEEQARAERVVADVDVVVHTHLRLAHPGALALVEQQHQLLGHGRGTLARVALGAEDFGGRAVVHAAAAVRLGVVALQPGRKRRHELAGQRVVRLAEVAQPHGAAVHGHQLGGVLRPVAGLAAGVGAPQCAERHVQRAEEALDVLGLRVMRDAMSRPDAEARQDAGALDLRHLALCPLLRLVRAVPQVAGDGTAGDLAIVLAVVTVEELGRAVRRDREAQRRGDRRAGAFPGPAVADNVAAAVIDDCGEPQPNRRAGRGSLDAVVHALDIENGVIAHPDLIGGLAVGAAQVRQHALAELLVTTPRQHLQRGRGRGAEVSHGVVAGDLRFRQADDLALVVQHVQARLRRQAGVDAIAQVQQGDQRGGVAVLGEESAAAGILALAAGELVDAAHCVALPAAP